ncbi:MAG TPA: hypothetical protein VNE16_08420 [Vicinamibacterales bacterium]|nr:hypothetical protein [Vicinamibacterales bacterium]
MSATLTAEGPMTTRAQIRSEYIEMPGLRLTTAQAARLWQLSPGESELVLGELVTVGFLRRTPSGLYVRKDSDTPA